MPKFDIGLVFFLLCRTILWAHIMQELVKTDKSTEINKQFDLKFWLNWINSGAISYSLSCTGKRFDINIDIPLIPDHCHEILLLWNVWPFATFLSNCKEGAVVLWARNWNKRWGPTLFFVFVQKKWLNGHFLWHS